MLLAPSPRKVRVRPGERAEPLDDRLQVRQDLAGMELVGQPVDHRYRAGRGKLLDALLAGGAPDDGGRLAGQHPGHVRDRLAPADMRGLRVDDQRQPAQLGDADLEGDPGAQRRLVEQDRRPPAGPPAAGSRTGLASSRRRGPAPRPARPGPGRRRAGSAPPWLMPPCQLRRCSVASAAARISGSAARNSSASAAVRISGGASRIASGCTGVDQEPGLRRAAASTSAATSAVSATPSHSRGRAPRRPAGG